MQTMKPTSPETALTVPPPEVAQLAVRAGVAKAKLNTLSLLVLALLAGAYISLGGMLFLVIVSGSDPNVGLVRVAGGIGFSLGLILVVVAGAELFTGNNLIAMAWASRKIGFRQVLRNWSLVYAGNVAGCLATVALVVVADLAGISSGRVGETALKVAGGKAALSWPVVFARGILCNSLVCVAVWLTLAARSVTDKVLVIIFPVTAFVALGLEHSIANWFFLPYGWWLDREQAISVDGIFRNLLAATGGNIVGGTLLVAGVYWIAYLRVENKSSV
jgi:formate transporter